MIYINGLSYLETAARKYSFWKRAFICKCGISRLHRKNALSFNLDYLGCSNIQNACLLTGCEAKAGLFIYRPSLNERVTKEVLDIIDNHIEKSLYTLERLRQKEGYNIEIEVFYSEEKVYDKVAAFVI